MIEKVWISLIDEFNISSSSKDNIQTSPLRVRTIILADILKALEREREKTMNLVESAAALQAQFPKNSYETPARAAGEENSEGSSSSNERQLLPDKSYSHLRCVQKLQQVHSTIWEVLTTPSPTRAGRPAPNRRFEEGLQEDSTYGDAEKEARRTDEENADSGLAPRPPAGSPPRSGRTPYKWELEHGEESVENKEPAQSVTPSTTSGRRKGRRRSKKRLLTSTAVAAAKNVPTTSGVEGNREKYREKHRPGERKEQSVASSQAPSPSTSPLNKSAEVEATAVHQPKTPEESMRKKRRPRRRTPIPSELLQPARRKPVEVENIHPNKGAEETVLVSSPSSSIEEEENKRKLVLERRRAQAAESKRQLDAFIKNRDKRPAKSKKKSKRVAAAAKNTDVRHRRSMPSTKGPIKSAKSTRKPLVAEKSSHLPPSSSPYSHLRCMQNLHIIHSPEKADVTPTDSETKNGGSSTEQKDADGSEGLKFEAVLVAGKSTPHPSVAVHYRDAALPSGQLRCLEVQLPIIEKPPEMTLKLFVEEYCEYMCHRLCVEAKPFRAVAVGQLRRIVTCLALKQFRSSGQPQESKME